MNDDQKSIWIFCICVGYFLIFSNGVSVPESKDFYQRENQNLRLATNPCCIPAAKWCDSPQLARFRDPRVEGIVTQGRLLDLNLLVTPTQIRVIRSLNFQPTFTPSDINGEDSSAAEGLAF